MSLVQGYTHSVLAPQLRSLGLSGRQREIVLADVTERLESLLSHWHDVPFRRTMLVVGTEEASFWEPRNASIDIRSLAAVCVRNSLVEDLNASHAYTESLRSATHRLPDELMPSITGEAIRYFQASSLDAADVQPATDIFGGLPSRFPMAWRVLSLLGNSPDAEITCDSPVENGAEPTAFPVVTRIVEGHSVILSGIDPGMDGILVNALRQIEQGELDLFFSPSLKGITRNTEKLLAIIEHVLRCGGTVLTPNYLLSPVYVARRNPLLRPAHSASEIGAQIANPVGLSKRHKDALTSITC